MVRSVIIIVVRRKNASSLLKKAILKRMMTRDELHERLKKSTDVFQNERLEEAFRAIDRADFVKEDYKVEAYEDYPLPIPDGQTISQPSTVFFMLEMLDPHVGDTVADIGAGSGYTTALLAHLVGKEGTVIGYEVRDSLVEFASKNIERYEFPQARIEKSSDEALRANGPYDRVLISAASAMVPDILRSILKERGVAVFVLDESLVKARKDGEELTILKQVPGFVFVPYIQND